MERATEKAFAETDSTDAEFNNNGASGYDPAEIQR